MYEALPKNEKTFDLEIIGEDTNIKYSGQFTVKCVLNMSGKHSLALEKTRLMADYANPSRDLAGIAISLATIRAKIISAPAWWKNNDNGALIMDENVIMAIYDKCEEMEVQWRAELKAQAGEASKESGEK
jgi:hypothetical protein